MIAAERFDPARFARALLDPELPPPCGFPARRFAVYRNNVVAGLGEALGARFPACKRLLGEECFRAVAVAHARRAPPRSRLMQEYGEEFPAFLENFAPLAPYPYLADVARLEHALGRAYHAADAEPLPPAALAAMPPEALERAALVLHPSVQLVASSHPIVAIWRANMVEGASPPQALDFAEDALVLRGGLTVEAHALPDGGYAFVAALSRGAALGEAIRMGQTCAKTFDLAAMLRLLLASGAIVGVHQ